MTKLEEIITQNRSGFDDRDPDPGHFQRFEQRLETSGQPRKLSFNRIGMLKVAAIIVFLITISSLVFDLATQEIRKNVFGLPALAELPLEVREAMQYYDQQVDQQLTEISKLSNTSGEAMELNQSAMKQIQALDDNTLELRKNLAESPGNGRIQEAILQNQKMKEGVLNTILFQLNSKKR